VTYEDSGSVDTSEYGERGNTNMVVKQRGPGLVSLDDGLFRTLKYL
jgi:hypothetical protein